MTALQGSPRFTGFIRRLVDEGVLSAEDMRTALANAKQEKRISWPIWSVIIIFPLPPLLKRSQ